MIYRYFRSIARFFKSSKLVLTINVIGLSIAFATVLVILNHLRFEMSFDRFHENYDEIYRVVYSRYNASGELEAESARTFQGVVPLLREEFPEVVASTRIDRLPANAGIPVMYRDQIFSMSSVFYVDSTFFSVFPTLIASGDPKTCLRNQHSIIFSEQLAKKIFGDDDAVGKSVLMLERNIEFVVTAVMKDLPDNSHFRMEMVIPFDYAWDQKEYHFQSPDRYSYITLRKDADVKSFEERLTARISEQQHDNEAVKGVRAGIQPLSEIHLSNMSDEFQPNSNRSVLYFLGFCVIVLLITAFVNAINLETAQLSKRIKSIGVQRLLGSTRKDMLLQFIRDYSAIMILALVIALALVMYLSGEGTFISSITKARFWIGDAWIWISVTVILLLGTFVTSIYPFLLLNDFKATSWLKGQLNVARQGGGSRRFFILFQFAGSFILIALVFITSGQLQLMFRADKGVDVENVVSIYNSLNYTRMEDSVRYEKFTSFKNSLLQNPAISGVTSSSAIPGMEIGFAYVNSVKRTLSDPFSPTVFKLLYVDYDFVPIYDLKLVAGRNYSLNRGEDQNWESVILNEAAVKALGFTTETALDQYIYFQQAVEWEKLKIIGIVSDHRQESFKSSMHPTIFYLHQYKGQQAYYSIRYDHMTSGVDALAGIREVWDEVWPSKPFEYFFLDAFYDKQYKADVELRNAFYMFAGATLFITCLGILGISLLEMKFRMKEIAIRLIHGATLRTLVILLSKGILTVLIGAFLIACPVIYLVGSKWLDYYTMRINITPIHFLGPFLIVFMLVALIVFLQVYRAVKVRPVTSLRNE